MTRYAVLLRGVNVGGHRPVPMAELRRLLEALGFASVGTYLQSGNAVATSDEPPDAVADAVHRALLRELGVDAAVMVRTAAEMAAVVAGNPFPDAAHQPRLLHVAFLSTDPTAEVRTRLDPAGYAPHAYAFGDRALYLRFATRALDRRLSGLPGRLGVPATARNWTTVTELAARTAVD